MSNINATLQSNLVLPVVDSLPASGTVGTQFVYQNNVYVFDSGGLPVRVGGASQPLEYNAIFNLNIDGGQVILANINRADFAVDLVFGEPPNIILFYLPFAFNGKVDVVATGYSKTSVVSRIVTIGQFEGAIRIETNGDTADEWLQVTIRKYP
jgi:hypothetical protein